MGLGHQKRGRAQQKLPPIMWTDLVFHLPPCQPPLEDLPLVKAREAWRSAGPPGQVADSSGRGHRTGRRKERKKLAPRAMAPILEHGRGGTGSSPTSCSTSKTPAQALSAPQAPRDAASREKPELRKILVDLRPVLENVMEPWDSWEGRSETRSVRSAGSSPRERGQPSRGGRDSRGGASAGEAQTHRVTSLPPIAAQPRDSGQAAAAREPHRSQAPAPRDGALARRAAPRREPTAPVSFPKISLQPEPAEQLLLPPERSSSAEMVIATVCCFLHSALGPTIPRRPGPAKHSPAAICTKPRHAIFPKEGMNEGALEGAVGGAPNLPPPNTNTLDLLRDVGAWPP
ncbi:PI-PLC X domain-containing protein 1 [Platysternon megacephalum]|uniref:PI-PLC X domain-containing protein 1 n=1 Tax=Platysternon megacephalum TaxID=55544 RepID=A0A4D9E6K3_9SAUR|nr:PI-PLC X domain-containing protein 1 [Platysternon megacephalum]